MAQITSLPPTSKIQHLHGGIHTDTARDEWKSEGDVAFLCPLNVLLVVHHALLVVHHAPESTLFIVVAWMIGHVLEKAALASTHVTYQEAIDPLSETCTSSIASLRPSSA